MTAKKALKIQKRTVLITPKKVMEKWDNELYKLQVANNENKRVKLITNDMVDILLNNIRR